MMAMLVEMYFHLDLFFKLLLVMECRSLAINLVGVWPRAINLKVGVIVFV